MINIKKFFINLFSKKQCKYKRIRNSRSRDIYLDLGYILSILVYRKEHINLFIKLVSKELKNIDSNQHLILDFTNTLSVSYNFIKTTCNRLVSNKVVTKDLYDNNIIILGNKKTKESFIKYFEYYLNKL